jgi:hypothetical protein
LAVGADAPVNVNALADVNEVIAVEQEIDAAVADVFNGLGGGSDGVKIDLQSWRLDGDLHTLL